MRRLLLLLALPVAAAEIRVAGLEKPVEIIRDRWGVPHIYAQTSADLFFAQGYITARDRLFQIDLWRRIGTGRLAEVLGPSMVARDRIARLVQFRGDWNAEWRAYSPDTREIAVAFTNGINAYIRSLGGARPLEFRLAGYDPGLWQPEDVVARIAGLLMTRNVSREVLRALDISRFGLNDVERFLPPDPAIPIRIPKGLNLADITGAILRDYNQAIGGVRFGESATPAGGDGDGNWGSNNWVVDGTLSATGKPLLASDPHRPVQIPSLRKTVHLAGPGWNAIGAGEPALPGIALGHNEHIGFGFTIVGIDQADLYVEKLNPANPDEYLYRGAWKRMEVVRETIAVAGARPRPIELRYTVHGPVIHEELGKHRAYALKWVGAEPGGAGYLAALAAARATNWKEFLAALERYKVPSENMVYADRAGNIGWVAAGLAPVRKNWSGLLPVPGDTGEYEWSGFLPLSEHPSMFNPPRHWIATANHNILPPGYRHALNYEWAAPFRARRVEEMLLAGGKFTVADFERMQQDVTSIPARRFQATLRRWQPKLGAREAAIVRRMLAWDCRMSMDAPEPLIYTVWVGKLHGTLFEGGIGGRVDLATVLRTLEEKASPDALAEALQYTLADLDRMFGPDLSRWKWGDVHTIHFRHPLNRAELNRGPFARPGDGNTVNSTSGANMRQTNGASFRMVLDLSDWDKSTMTNTPGESGDPSSPHYSDLVADWAAGRYHPMPFSRKAVEAAAVERIRLLTP
jgi:penicillin amidase